MTQYIHNVPGRIRVKIPILRNDEEKGLEIQTNLGMLDGVEKISVNTVTGSIVVHYDPDELKPWQILGQLEAGGFINLSETITDNSYYKIKSSKAGEALGKALFGWAVGKAFEGSGLSILTAFI